MAAHHPTEEILLAYASGSLDESMALLVATHLTLCPACRDEVRGYEALGGVLLEELPPAAIGSDRLPAVLNRLDGDGTAAVAASAPAPADPSLPQPPLPQPLRDYVGGRLDRLRWAWVMPGLRAADLGLGRRPARTRLMRVRAGMSIPRHTHAGREATLVLAGGFTDEYGHCRRGDVRFSDETVTHRQVIDSDEDCLCLLVADGPIRLTGPLGYLVNRFLPF